MKNLKAVTISTFAGALLSIIILNSCKKEVSKQTDTPTVLLSKIISNTPGAPDFGKTIDVFTYSGKKLIKVVNADYFPTGSSPSSPIDSIIATTTFTYNNAGILSGIQYKDSISMYNIVNVTLAVITDNAGNIITYNLLQTNSLDLSGTTDSISYQNNLLSSWHIEGIGRLAPVDSRTNFAYNSSGNNISQTSISNNFDGTYYTTVLTNSTFDTNHNILRALPYWIFFKYYSGAGNTGYPGLNSLSPGLNNPLSVNDNGTAFIYNYEYNSYGYPSKISWNETTPLSYSYIYTAVY
jgi:hypothetical protein